MSTIAHNHLADLVSNSCWGPLVTAEIKTWVDLSKLEPKRITRIANGLKRGRYTGLDRNNTNVAVFCMLCDTFKIPHVLKGINEAEFPVHPDRIDNFAEEVIAMMHLDKGEEEGEGKAGTVRIMGVPSKVTNPEGKEWYERRSHRQFDVYPVVKFYAPNSGYGGIFNLYEKYAPPCNQPGINDAVRVLRQGVKFEIPMEYTKHYLEKTGG